MHKIFTLITQRQKVLFFIRQKRVFFLLSQNKLLNRLLLNLFQFFHIFYFDILLTIIIILILQFKGHSTYLSVGI